MNQQKKKRKTEKPFSSSKPSTREKMIFRIQLLFRLTSCVCASLVVNVAQTYYQAEQNHSITLEWTFTPKPDTSITSVHVYCDLLTDLRDSVLFHLHEGVEASESQDQQFSGRVQFDKDVLREGRLRLQLSRLRTDDSGRYECSIRTSDGWNVGRCRLNVTAAADQPETQRPDVRRQPEDPQQGTRLYSELILIPILILILGLVAVALFAFCTKTSSNTERETGLVMSEASINVYSDTTCLHLPAALSTMEADPDDVTMKEPLTTL